MCDKCQEIVARIELYRRMMLRVDGDPQDTAGIAGLIKEAEAEKIALHRPVQIPHPSKITFGKCTPVASVMFSVGNELRSLYGSLF